MPGQLPARRRGLVLAGGGLKAAYAGGVLEQLLPTLGHERKHPAFTHVQAASSGIFNAAMMASQKTAGDIGDAWRYFRPLRALSINWSQVVQLVWGDSLLTWNRFLKNIALSRRRHGWALKLPIETSDQTTRCQYVFNAYNFSRHALVAFSPEQLDVDRFRACIALPRWFPPVRIGTTYDDGEPASDEVLVDAVFATDSNASALPLNALDEIWVIWTVDVQGRWRNGWAANYFRMLEQSAAAAYAREREVIIDAGFTPAHMIGANSRPKKVLYEIAGDVPLHYLFGFTRRGVQRALRQGTEDAQWYLDEHERLWKAP